MKRKSKIVLIIVLFILIVSLISGLFYFKNLNDNKEKEEEIIEEPIKNEEKEELLVQEDRQLWLANKQINEDYQGEIIFESGLINKSFVQAQDVYDKDGELYHFYTENGRLVDNPAEYSGNDVYLYTNWQDMSYDYNILGGSIFMDYRNYLDDQNIIIYGHHFSNKANDPQRNKAFTPLEKLLEEENYELGQKVKLVLDNEDREYELVGVYIFDSNDNYCLNNLQFYRTNYNIDDFTLEEDENYYQNYIETLKQVILYQTGVELTTNDRTLTLQTCIGGYAGIKSEICVYKETKVTKYQDLS